MDSDRHCVRPGCGAPATASLTYHYASSTVWLDDITGEADPARWDLCALHADGLTVPRGWTREDRRSPARLPFPRTIAV